MSYSYLHRLSSHSTPGTLRDRRWVAECCYCRSDWAWWLVLQRCGQGTNTTGWRETLHLRQRPRQSSQCARRKLVAAVSLRMEPTLTCRRWLTTLEKDPGKQKRFRTSHKALLKLWMGACSLAFVTDCSSNFNSNFRNKGAPNARRRWNLPMGWFERHPPKGVGRNISPVILRGQRTVYKPRCCPMCSPEFEA